MIEAASAKKRYVDVDFGPVFVEIDKLKHDMRDDSEVLEAIGNVRKDQQNIRDETSRLVSDLTDTVSNDVLKATEKVEQVEQVVTSIAGAVEELRGHPTEVDFSPVLDAVGKVDI